MRVHHRLQWRRDPDGTPYRARRSFPDGPANATVLLSGPGTVSVLDGTGRDDVLLDRLTATLRLHLLRQLADALRYAQSRRVIHRALSPQSVLVGGADSDTPTLPISGRAIGSTGS